MGTKTDRILGYLPGTFRALPPPTALHSFVDAFGRELLVAENSLAEVMQAHWVDYADKGTDVLRDLVRFASPYGLAPRLEEEVEEFREHLRRYVRTFLEGTVTPQGILRIAAESLALHIEDRYGEMDTWWTRPSPVLVTVHRNGADAASLVLGREAVSARGLDAAPGAVTGTVDLLAGADLGGGATLRVRTESSAAEIDLAADGAAVTLDDIVSALAPVVAATPVGGRFLRVSSRVSGPDSFLTFEEGPGDAAEAVLGLPARVAAGSSAYGAALSTPPLSGGVDLDDDERFVRVTIDGRTREVDLGTGHKDLEDLRFSFNTAFASDLASHDGTTLTLRSPTTGRDSRVSLDAPAAQDAGPLLFGGTNLRATGADEAPARLVGRNDLTAPVDLSATRLLRLRIDGNVRTVDVAGADPAATRRAEIVAAINSEFGAEVAASAGFSMAVASPTPGAAGEVALEDVAEGDAGERLFGIPPRTYRGSGASPARVAGPALAPADMMARHLLGLSVDGGPLQVVDLRRRAADPRAVTVGDAVEAVNEQVFSGLATDAGGALALTSPTPGAGSSIAVERLSDTRERGFVTRAAVTDEASQALFGFVERTARGTDGTGAVLQGDVDVSRGVDLSSSAHLRIAVDGGPYADVGCAGPRPRTTLLDEVVAAVNETFPGIASGEGGRLTLRSPTPGDASSVVLDVPRPGLDLLGLTPGLTRGTPPASVRLVSTVDLHDGVDLPDGAALSIGFDGRPPVEVALAAGGAERATLGQIATRINVALGAGLASHDPARLQLSSLASGAASSLELAAPAGTDVTELVLGVSAPRAYRGREATPAVVTGALDLAGTHDVRNARRFMLGIDGGELVEVDVSAAAADPSRATLDEIVAAIEAAVAGVATRSGDRLVLTSPSSGSASRIELAAAPADDARDALLGDVEPSARGTAALPAVLTGDVEVTGTVDLTQRAVVRIAIDGEYPVDVNAAGPAPWATSADEAAARLDATLSATVEVTPEGKLRVASPTAGNTSTIAIVPLRHLELIEFPRGDAPGSYGPVAVRHGAGFAIPSDNVGDETATISLTALASTAGPAFVNEAVGWEVRVEIALPAGARLKIAPADRGLSAWRTGTDGVTRRVRPEFITVSPPGAVARIPFEGERRAPVTLDDPAAPGVARLRELAATAADAPSIEVREAASAGWLPDGAAVGTRGAVVGRLGAGGDVVEVDGTVVRLDRAAPDLAGRVVVAAGVVVGSAPLLLRPEIVAPAFDVIVRGPAGESEAYHGVTIGHDATHDRSFELALACRPSALLTAEPLDKSTALRLHAGRSRWRYLDCLVARFDATEFGGGVFGIGPCGERGVFDVSRFVGSREAEWWSGSPGEPVSATAGDEDRDLSLFDSAASVSGATAEVSFSWSRRAAGTFAVNLPPDLHPRFGARFNHGRFSKPGDEPESYVAAVTEPEGDERFLAELIKKGHPGPAPAAVQPSDLVTASVETFVPLGWSPVPMPFRKPRKLTLGGPGTPACIYLSEEGLGGAFLRIAAKENGTWGNDISISARTSGPARFDVTIALQSARFEIARATVLGDPPPVRAADLAEASRVGLLQAKAAGVSAAATREPSPGMTTQPLD